MKIVLAVLSLSLIILVHELGHFLAAKAVGMRVEVFSIGFWKRIVGVKLGETDYRLSLIPLGGYVKVSGESPPDAAGKPYEFWSKSPGQRAVFIVGGVTMSFVLAFVLFILAFAIGVPFIVAEVGQTVRGEAAWEAGVKPGDRIVAIGDRADPVFEDVARDVALGGSQDVELKVERDGELLTFRLTSQYNEQVGMRLIGFRPPIEPVVGALVKVGGQDGRCPAEEAGVEIGDRIVAVNDREVKSAYDLHLELTNYPHEEIELLVERNGRTFPLRVLTEPAPHYIIGISGLSTAIESLEGGGMAQQAGLQVGDQITAVNGQPIQSNVEVELAARRALGEITFTVLRQGQALTFALPIPDVRTLEQFHSSMVLRSGTTLTWVRDGGPAWNVGVRPGDRLVSKAGKQVSTWEDIVGMGARAGRKEHEIQWARGSEVFTARVTPVRDTSLSGGRLGIIMDRQKTTLRRYGVLGAVTIGCANTFRSLGDVALTLRGFARRDVSTRQMGGIVLIAQASYYAADRGIGMLLYTTAVIAAAIAFVNILPIPILDGGHLLFVVIERVRGRRLGERALIVAQTAGLVFLVALIAYATRNDILRILGR